MWNGGEMGDQRETSRRRQTKRAEQRGHTGSSQPVEGQVVRPRASVPPVGQEPNRGYEGVLPGHPHDYFAVRHVAVVPNTCFVLMPFGGDFTLVYETIAKALEGLMGCSRADDLALGHPILDRILEGISSAELIVADLTKLNPNVFYELGLAHCWTKNVLLLTQSINNIPFDLRGLFCHAYNPRSTSGLEELRTIVRKAAEKVRAKALPAILKGADARTRQIVEYMEHRLSARMGPQPLIVRLQSGLSSLANEGFWGTEDPDKQEYGQWLERERDQLIRTIESGAVLRAILCPPKDRRSWDKTDRWRRRFDRLLEFLRKRTDCLGRCEFVLSVEESTNLLFFDEDVLFEGYKTGIEGGYGWTMVYTDRNYLLTRLTIFDMLFQSARDYTMRVYGTGRRKGSTAKSLLEAVIRGVEMARDGIALTL
jgi:hypothetical protein